MSSSDVYDGDYQYFQCGTCSALTYVAPIGVVLGSGEPACINLACEDLGVGLNSLTREDFLVEAGEAVPE